MKITLRNKPIDKRNLPYRQGVVGIVVDDDDNFLLVQMVDYSDTDWRFPGGGVNVGEKLKDALLRELEEELGSRNFEIVKKSSLLNQYEWPDTVIISQFKKKKKVWRGQRQAQFLVKFKGKRSEINPDSSEIKRIEWVKYSELKNHFTFPNQWEKTKEALKDLL